MTHGSNIFGNICNSVAKGSSNVVKNIQKSVGNYEGALNTASATTATTATTASGKGINTGTGGAGKVETFILKNHINKHNKGDNIDGCPLASNETSYSYSDYDAY